MSFGENIKGMSVFMYLDMKMNSRVKDPCVTFTLDLFSPEKHGLSAGLCAGRSWKETEEVRIKCECVIKANV